MRDKTMPIDPPPGWEWEIYRDEELWLRDETGMVIANADFGGSSSNIRWTSKRVKRAALNRKANEAALAQTKARLERA